MTPAPELEILLPVHNEADSIRATVQEIYDQLSPQVSLRFIICEDGSKDDTKNILRELAKSIPMNLLLSDARKGYSRAVRDGMQALEAPFLLAWTPTVNAIPKTSPPSGPFAMTPTSFSAGASSARTIGCANPCLARSTSCTSSGMHDPSCPFVLPRKQVVDKLVGELGAMQQGFWWEYVARVYRRGFTLPGIGWRHFLALFQILRETRSSASASRSRTTRDLVPPMRINVSAETERRSASLVGDQLFCLRNLGWAPTYFPGDLPLLSAASPPSVCSCRALFFRQHGSSDC